MFCLCIIYPEGCKLSVPVGIENGQIPDRAFTATSSRYNGGWQAPAFMARLNSRDTYRGGYRYIGAWCADGKTVQFLQVRARPLEM